MSPPMDPNLPIETLWAFFAGRATTLQKQLLTDWLKDERNVETFYRALHEWEKANPQLIPDTSADWQLLQTRLVGTAQSHSFTGESKERHLPTFRRFNAWWLAVAASILLILGGYWQKERLLYQTYSTTYGQTRHIRLLDGSQVTLNANSRLSFPRFIWLLSTREAQLVGEAEFSVVHTYDNRPFVVRTPDLLEVRVLGTEFTVYSRERGSRVMLSRGKVALRSLKTDLQPLTMHPGDVVRINPRGTFELQPKQLVTDYTAWKQQRFVFNRTSLNEIADQIQERFGVRVLIPDSTLGARQMSGNYPAKNADEVITMLTQLLHLHVEQRDNDFILTN
jgi:transmembrane sensor